jgi:hypothetical protein
MRASKKLKNLIMEQLNQDQLEKLSHLLHSDNESDLTQGLSLVQSFITEDDMYPGVVKLRSEER